LLAEGTAEEGRTENALAAAKLKGDRLKPPALARAAPPGERQRTALRGKFGGKGPGRRAVAGATWSSAMLRDDFTPKNASTSWLEPL